MDRQLNAFEALKLLGSLENLTRESLPQTTPVSTAAARAPALPARSASPKPTLPADTQFETTTEEYKPALRDQSVIEALLQFHAQSQISQPSARPSPPAPATPNTATPNPAKPNPGAPTGLQSANPSEQEQRFRPAALPGIAARPKPSQHFRKSGGVYQTILRPESTAKK